MAVDRPSDAEASIRVVDAAVAPWIPGSTEGLTFQCQVLLSGDDGGPEALRFAFDPTPSVYAHMHLTSQFQLVLSGTMFMPRGSLELTPRSVHYTDHNVPYGPFSVGVGHDMLVLHPKAGGLVTMGNLEARSEINKRGRLIVGFADAMPWSAENRPPGVARSKVLIPSELGPSTALLTLEPNAVCELGAGGEFGRYEVVVSGSVFADGIELRPPGFRFLSGDEVPPPLLAGPDGAEVMLLCFDADAVKLLGEEGIMARSATDAMVLAI